MCVCVAHNSPQGTHNLQSPSKFDLTVKRGYDVYQRIRSLKNFKEHCQ